MRKLLSLFMITPYFLLAASSSSVAAVVVEDPKSTEELVKFLPLLIDAFKHSQWLLFGALTTMVLIFVFRQYVLPKLNFSTAILPLLSAVIGVPVGLSIAIVGGASPKDALLAVLSGPVASTLWAALAKHFMPEAPAIVQPK